MRLAAATAGFKLDLLVSRFQAGAQAIRRDRRGPGILLFQVGELLAPEGQIGLFAFQRVLGVLVGCGLNGGLKGRLVAHTDRIAKVRIKFERDEKHAKDADDAGRVDGPELTQEALGREDEGGHDGDGHKRNGVQPAHGVAEFEGHGARDQKSYGTKAEEEHAEASARMRGWRAWGRLRSAEIHLRWCKETPAAGLGCRGKVQRRMCQRWPRGFKTAWGIENFRVSLGTLPACR